jgi:hypothetical protein
MVREFKKLSNEMEDEEEDGNVGGEHEYMSNMRQKIGILKTLNPRQALGIVNRLVKWSKG